MEFDYAKAFSFVCIKEEKERKDKEDKDKKK